MRTVAERLDGVEHALPGRRADAAAIAQHIGYRRRGDARVTRDFAECGHGVFNIWDDCPTFASPPKARHHLSHRQTTSETGKAQRSHMRSLFSASLIKRLISDFELIKSRSRCNGEHFLTRLAEG